MKNIGSKILLSITLLCISIVVIISIISINNSSSAIKKEATEKMTYYAEAQKNYFGQVFNGVQGAVENLAIASSYDFNNAQNKAYMENYSKCLGNVIKKYGENTAGTVSVYFYANPDVTKGVYGSWYAKDSEAGEFTERSLGSQTMFDKSNDSMKWYYNAAAAGKGIWTDPYVDADLKLKMISYTVPLYDNGKLLGVAGMDIRFDYFSKRINALKCYDSGYAFLVDKDLRFLIHPTYSGEKMDEVDGGVLKPYADSMKSNASGIFHYSIGGISKQLAFERMDNGFIISITAPESEIYEKIDEFRKEAIVFLIITMIISIIVGYLISIWISRPVKQITSLIDTISDFDLRNSDISSNLCNRQDEIGTMAKSVNHMRSSLVEIINYLAVAANETNESAASVEELTEELKEQIEQTLANIEEISAGLQETASAAEEIAEVICRIDGASSEIADKAEKGSKLSSDITERAAVLKSEATLSSVNTKKVYNETKTIVHDAIERAKVVHKIDVLAQTILSISSQTNLLSLNASIEAARAGEAGKGFQVVAEEIRKLAEESSNAVIDIKEIVGVVNSSVSNLSENTVMLLECIDRDILKDYGKFIETSEKYSSDAIAFHAFMMEFSATAEELNASIETISTSIELVAGTVVEGSKGTNEITSKMDHAAQKVNKVWDTTGCNKECVEKLKTIISKFTI